MADGLVVELAVESPGDCPVATASADTGATVSGVDRAQVADDSGRVAEEFALPASVTPTDDGLARVASIDDRDVYRFERDGGGCVCEVVEDVAGPVAAIHASGGTLRVRIRVRSVETVREVVAHLRRRFGDVELVRVTRADGGTDADVALVDRTELTDRQREVLETAHEMGYFDYPGDANTAEVASALDISSATVSEHLAAAQSKLLRAILDE